ncbi:sugar-binding protein [Pullulanibacillus camelliae]|uniref:Sugar-binding protein n=1 Tax=Pullulanibacillus camelliae TaxID=1707096 RepID=A0A8J2YB16_9BACL|nr:extracellular solute-binding protein [Pullulanibacillus camelliae]GGE26120.1 sugar-binding protein [Pullulanibacillus camelliae]
MVFKMKKSWSLLLLGVVLVFALSACGSNDSNGASKDGKVTLTLWNAWSGDTSDTRLYNERVKKFNDSHPDITIKTETTDSDNYRTKLKTRAAGKQLPDIFQVWPGSELEPIVKGGAMAPIDSLTDDLKGKLINENTLKDFAVDGKQYAIPTSVSYTNLVFYDKDMIKKVGYDQFPTTYSDFKTLIKKLKAEGITPIELGNKPQWPLQSIYVSMIADRITGSDYLPKVLAGKAKFTDPGFVKALNVVKELNDMQAFNKDVNTINDDQAMDNFVQGKSAIFISGSWSTTGLLDKKSKDKHIGTARMPAFEGGKGDPTKVSGVGAVGLGINSNLSGAKKKAALEFLKYFYSKDLYEDLLKAGLLIPAKVDLPKDTDPLFKEAYQATEGGTAPVYDGVLPAELTQTLNNGLQGILTGSMTPEKLAKEMQSQVNQ